MGNVFASQDGYQEHSHVHPESSAARAALTSIPFFDNLATRRLKILEELFVRREFDEGDMIVNPAGVRHIHSDLY